MHQLLTTIGGVPVFRIAKSAFCWTSGMTIDADGSPRAYHPQSGQGLDLLANAGKPGNWWGIVTRDGTPGGEPVIQGQDAPAYDDSTRGFYVSPTSLVVDPSRPARDPRRYANSEKLPFIVIPGRFVCPVKLGSRALVTNLLNGKQCEAVVADIGPRTHIGEGSIALAEALGLDASPRKGGAASAIHFIVFDGLPAKPLDELRERQEA